MRASALSRDRVAADPHPDENVASIARPAAGRRLLVVYNPTAGGRRAERLRASVAHLRTLGCSVEVRHTRGAGDATEIASTARDLDTLVVAGGDGTINEALNGLADNRHGDLPLAVIPMGTANVLAAELGLPRTPRALAEAIAGGPARRVHLGLANGRRFALMTGVGFDAHVVAAIRPGVKRLLGKAAYVITSLGVATRYTGARYRVEIDGTDYEAASVVVCKGHYYAGRYVLAGEARPWIPELHVCLFERSGALQPLRYALAMQFDRLRDLPDFRVIPARRVRIAGPADDPVQGDGDWFGRLPVEITLLENAARFIVPADTGAR